MAKLQRWRRSRSAGEGISPAEGGHDEIGEIGEVDETDPDFSTEEHEAASEEPAAEADVDLQLEADQDELDPEPLDVEDAEDEVLDVEDVDVEDVDVEDVEDDDDWQRPATTPQRAGFLTWLTRGTHPREWIVFSVLQAAHLKQAIVTALAMGLAAILTGRPARESGVIVLTVLVGSMILGWHNDLTDKRSDIRHKRTDKPVADGRLRSGAVVYAMVAGTLVLLPLAFTTGITAGCIYMASVAIGMLGNIVLRTGIFSFWSWAISYGMLPYYLSYGGWGGQAVGTPPNISIVILAALLGVGIHFTRAVWGLVADHEDGWTYLPLRLGMKFGATRLLAMSSAYIAIILILLAVFGAKDGLST